jgi:hypothetical protein
MREETVTYKVFKFSELSEDAKKKAIEHFYNINVDFDWWDFTYESIKESLEEVGLSCKKIYFSLDRDEHIELSDLRFTDVTKFIHSKIDDKVKQSLIDIADIYVSQSCGRHTINHIESNGYGFYARCPRVNKAVDSLIDQCNEVLNAMMNDFIAQLRAEYEYLTSEESIVETIECNEYEFLENGSLYR